ncbi:MAG TPA: peroxide stress protein YaaA [Acidimicrobiales bacterium]|nr:peroxide stress protein YaaA [Acidimicrobiales bacterium]
MSPAPLILLPPSEGKATGGSRIVGRDRFASSLEEPRHQVREALRVALETMTPERLSHLFGARGERCGRAISAATKIIDGEAKVMPAWRRYTGVVWEHLDPSTIPGAARSRILVPSGLYGVTRSDDEIVDYRLTMLVSLPNIGNLGRFWAGPVSSVLHDLRGRPTVISLLPREHARVVIPASVASLIEVQFLAADGGGAAGHAAKAVKGRFARHLIDHGIDDALAFRFEGWKISRAGDGYVLRAPR